jgi:hypothetical protein
VLSTSKFSYLLVPRTLGTFQILAGMKQASTIYPAGIWVGIIVGVQYIIPGMKWVYQMIHGYTHLVRFLATHVDG